MLDSQGGKDVRQTIEPMIDVGLEDAAGELECGNLRVDTDVLGAIALEILDDFREGARAVHEHTRYAVRECRKADELRSGGACSGIGGLLPALYKQPRFPQFDRLRLR